MAQGEAPTERITLTAAVKDVHKELTTLDGVLSRSGMPVLSEDTCKRGAEVAEPQTIEDMVDGVRHELERASVRIHEIINRVQSVVTGL